MACSCDTVDQNAPICLTSGEDKTLVITAMKDGVLYDATNAKVFCTIKKNVKDKLPTVLKRTLNAGGSDAEILVITPQTLLNIGRIEIYLSHADTVKLVAGTAYVLDAWLISTTNKYAVLIKLHDVTVGASATLLP